MTSSSQPLRTRLLASPLPAAVALIIAVFCAIQGVQLLYPPGYDGVGWLWLLARPRWPALPFTPNSGARASRCWLPTRPPSSPCAAWPRLCLLLAGLALAVVTVVSLASRDNHEQMRILWIASLALLVAGSSSSARWGRRRPWGPSRAARATAACCCWSWPAWPGCWPWRSSCGSIACSRCRPASSSTRPTPRWTRSASWRAGPTAPSPPAGSRRPPCTPFTWWGCSSCWARASSRSRRPRCCRPS